MARINTNVPSLVAQQHLSRANSDLMVRLERLSTGLRINRGSDDPAGLITSERLRSDLRGIDQAIANSERASSVIAVAEGALIEVSDLLNSIKAMVVEAANTGGVSEDEIAANQLQVDSAIESITRIANSTNFAGLKLLNGELDYILSGVDSSDISKAQIFSANFGDNDTLPVSVEVLGSAQVAQLFLTGNAGATAGTIPSGFTIEIAGNEGVATLTVTSGQSMSQLVTAVNNLKGVTGVSASLVSATNDSSGVIFSSTEYGSDAFVSVERMGDLGSTWFNMYAADDSSELLNSGNIDLSEPVNRDIGQDVTALVNGLLAAGDGLRVSTNAPTLSLSLLLEATLAQDVGESSTFTITGGGSVFQLGPQVSNSQQVSLGLQSVSASRVGGTLVEGELMFLNSLVSGGSYDLDGGNLQSASKILETAIAEVAIMRGRLGAFERNTLETNIRSMQAAFENITASESAIRDADFAAETSALTRAQILTQAGTSVLVMANTTAQNVLQLLG
ncbi:MAG: flagellin [Phycisphaerales bacterium]|nr:flagellin [Phycisphaerales bacterium]